MRKRVFLPFLFICAIIVNTPNVQAQVNQSIDQQIAREKVRLEKERYERACSLKTESAYKEYLDLYPNGKYVSDVKNRLKDFELWERAKSKNSFDAYNDYLKNSEFKTHATEAKLAIKILESLDEWSKISDSKNIKDFERFLTKYPESSLKTKANNKIHELRALDYYESGYLILALNEFDKAGGRDNINFYSRPIYDACQEYNEYQMLRGKTLIFEFKYFLKKYPKGQYSEQVSNSLAILLAKGLTKSSNTDDFAEALNYAKDKETRDIVQGYINKSKNERRDFLNSLKTARKKDYKKENGGILNFGIEIMDMALNPMMYGDYESGIDIVGYYNLGIGLKIGNYKAPVQFEIGVKPGMTWVDMSVKETNGFIFHFPAYARLKVNLFGELPKYYVDITGYKNIIADEYYESEFATSGGFGVAWRHWDWLILYYKYNINSNERVQYSLNPNNQFLGTSLRYFF